MGKTKEVPAYPIIEGLKNTENFFLDVINLIYFKNSLQTQCRQYMYFYL